MRAGALVAVALLTTGIGAVAGFFLAEGMRRESMPAGPRAARRGESADSVETRWLRNRIAELEAGASVAVGAAPPSEAPEVAAGPTIGRERSAETAIDASRVQVMREGAELRARVVDLQAELDRLRITLPEPAIRKDLAGAPTDDLLALASELRSTVQHRLLEPKARLKQKYAEFLQEQGTGLARILPRGKYENVIEKRGGGAYWSFYTKDNSYNAEPDLGLQNDQFLSGFAGSNKGYLLDLGDRPLQDVVTQGRAAPAGLGEEELARWNLLWSDASMGVKEEPPAVRKWSDVFGSNRSVPAVLEHTYLLRSWLDGQHEILVVFRYESADEYGADLVWKVLKDWNIPRGR